MSNLDDEGSSCDETYEAREDSEGDWRISENLMKIGYGDDSCDFPVKFSSSIPL